MSKLSNRSHASMFHHLINALAGATVCLILLFANPSFGHTTTYEENLLKVIALIEQSDTKTAWQETIRLQREFANSTISQMILGDLYTARLNRLDRPGVGLARFNQQHMQAGYIEEIALRHQHSKDDSPIMQGLVPVNILLPAISTRHVIFVDLPKSRVYLYSHSGDGSIKLVDDFYATIGQNGIKKIKEGDKRTPVGVYQITGYIPGEELPDRYGPGAFPIDYPNVIDKRLQRTGYGIWFHGTESDKYNRIPKASDGCISLNNNDFLKFKEYLSGKENVPVIMVDKAVWVTTEEIAALRSEVLKILARWRDDWQSMNHQQYISHYSPSNFISDTGMRFPEWDSKKQKINATKSYIQIALNDIDIYYYPGEESMLRITFKQDYRSDNHNSSSYKSLYFLQNNNKWEIIYEGIFEKVIQAPPSSLPQTAYSRIITSEPKL